MAGLQKVLLIEDNLQLQEIYTVTLETNGYQIEVAGNGPQGLQKAMMFVPDIIFLDIMMPGMNGLEVLKHLRERPEYNAQNCKIVLLTNLGHDERIEEAWRKHADGYVIKAEISPEELIDVIHSLESPTIPAGQLPVAYVPAPTGTVPGVGQPIVESTPVAVPPAQEPTGQDASGQPAVPQQPQPISTEAVDLPVAAMPPEQENSDSASQPAAQLAGTEVPESASADPPIPPSQTPEIPPNTPPTA